MTILHAAALPYPSHQGTQAALAAMLETLAAHDRPSHLLTHAHGAYALDPPFVHHRLPDVPKVRSLESGPSWGRVALDVQMIRTLRRLERTLRPSVVVAHHVEATTAALAAGMPRVVFFAHTALGPELPTYLAPSLRRIAEALGSRLDEVLARRAHAVAAISPCLRASFEALAGREVHYVPLPWPLPPPEGDEERVAARRALGLGSEAEVVLYAGNFDRYQGVDLLLESLARLRERPALRLLVATRSDVRELRASLSASGLLERTHIVALDGEPQRRRIHAAADVVAVPRRAAGGLPVKLLDALARGVPTVATSRATAGLALEGVAIVTDDSADALAAGILHLLENENIARTLRAAGRAFVAHEHGPTPFLAAFDRLLAEVGRNGGKPA